MLLRALDAGVRGDLQGEVDAWLEDVDGFPAYTIIMGSIATHVSNVVAIASGYELTTADAMHMAQERFGEYNLPETIAHTRAVVITPKDGKGSPLYFESAERLSEALAQADRWKLLDGDPQKQSLPFDEKVGKPCDRDDCTEVVAVCGHEQLVEKMGVVGDEPWGQPKIVDEHEWTETPWGFECKNCEWDASEGARNTMTEEQARCAGKDPQEALDEENDRLRRIAEGEDSQGLSGIQAEEKPDHVRYAEDQAEIEEQSETPAGTPNVPCLKCRFEAEGVATPVEGTHHQSCPLAAQELIDRIKTATDEIAAKANAEGKIAPLSPEDGLVSCERCYDRMKPGATIVDGFGVRRCGTCHRANEMGLDDPTKFCQKHPKGEGRFPLAECPTCKSERGADPAPGDGSGSSGSSAGEEAEAIDGATWVDEAAYLCGVEHPKTGKPCEQEPNHEGLHDGASFADGIPPDTFCGACEHLGMHHDHRTKKCAQCKLCTGYVARIDMPDVGPSHPAIPPRWKVSCPACPANKTTSVDPTGEACRECGCKDQVIGLCGEPSDASPFDWARFLVKNADRIEAQQPRRCRICRDSVAFGARIWQHQDNKASVAHERCVTEQLGYAIVLLQEGKLVEAELNEEAADAGEAKNEMCCVCGKDIEPGETCYAHEDTKVFAHYSCVQGKATEPPVSESDARDLCEWHPEKDRAAAVGDPFHSVAHVVVGSGKKGIRLCHSCRKLKPHSRLRKEVPIVVQTATC